MDLAEALVSLLPMREELRRSRVEALVADFRLGAATLVKELVEGADWDGRYAVATALIVHLFRVPLSEAGTLDAVARIVEEPLHGVLSAIQEAKRRYGFSTGGVESVDNSPALLVQSQASVAHLERHVSVLSAAVLKAWTRKDVYVLANLVEIDDGGEALVKVVLEAEEPVEIVPT